MSQDGFISKAHFEFENNPSSACNLRGSCGILPARIKEGAGVEEAEAESRVDHRGQRTHHSQAAASKIRGHGGFKHQAFGNQGVVGVGAGRGRLREFNGGQNPACDASGVLDGAGERPNSAHGGSESSHARSHRHDHQYEAVLVTPQEGWNIICRMQAFERLLTLLVAVTGLRIGEVLALR
jgi:hypothetical protein